ncbi:MAG: FUSC family protein, partial [Pedobacter sp.]
MLKPLDSFKNFLYTQYFSDGIKITIGVLLPSLLFFKLNMIEVGMTLSIGAVCSSMADSPGPWIHRRNAMLVTNAIVTVVALITSVLNNNPLYIGTELIILCFVFSMFHVYGVRASAVGTAAIFIMIINVDSHHTHLNYLEQAGLIISGGAWYFLLSLFFSKLRPYRYAQQTLGECIQEIAGYMRLRANFYNDKIAVNDIFKNLVDKQVTVHELQDNVREVLFKTRKLVNDSTNAGRLLIVIFADMVDLFEQTMATHHDYEIIRTRYKNYDILPSFALLIHKLSTEIEYIGFCLIHQIEPRKHALSMKDLDDLKFKLDELEKQGVQVLILKKIIINLRHIYTRTNVIYSY